MPKKETRVKRDHAYISVASDRPELDSCSHLPDVAARTFAMPREGMLLNEGSRRETECVAVPLVVDGELPQ